jgi:class III poly(R)-hydroxyalkanoic acid synthase PhaC subunit
LQILQTNSHIKPDEALFPYCDYWYRWYDFALKYNSAFFNAAASSVKTFFDVRDAPIQKIHNAIRASFDSTLREDLMEDSFTSSLANLMDANVQFAKLGYNISYRNYSDLFSSISKLFEPLRDTIFRTPSEEIKMKGRFNLLHYKPEVPKKQKTPILVVYSLINRHYIMDLLPKVSIIRNLQRQGFDIYATDWGTPNSLYKDMSLETYAHEYVENAVDKIKEITSSEKISLLGYCWGGIFALIYSAIHPENVKNLILHATPLDLEEVDTPIENWTAHINADRLVEVFGNVPGSFLNTAFLLRNPVEAVLKYSRFFAEPRSFDEITQFFSIETWLYDSVPIIGEVYRDIVDQIYKKNLLIKNKMKVGSDLIDLTKITMPLLNIVGAKDDLVPPQSNKSIMNVIDNNDKKLMEFPTGHVGLCTSIQAHEQLWPEVGKWLSERS